MSSFAIKALMAIGTLGTVSGGSYLIHEYLIKEKDIRINHDEIVSEYMHNKEKEFKTSTGKEYLSNQNDLDLDLLCEFLKNEKNGKQENGVNTEDKEDMVVKGRSCKNYMKKILGNEEEKWPVIWLRVKQENFKNTATFYQLIKENSLDSSESIKWEERYSCIKEDPKENENRVIVKCDLKNTNLNERSTSK
ncbi:hypothetical protein [Mycoplasma parvum]|uniref:Uncharacterized protein n=1 Tax=Mycoplasma parvum str. Indiana TaxID=1403316 RepID=U5NGA9_9MOLU|nr:hypothetical protein [Mycoplasma parvum]AGX89308.1 hypothetical protein PRV_02910 [Mycoplasma parvum str. Indiana]